MPGRMLPGAERLLVVSRTGRAMAESARRGGLSCLVIDAFADVDTRAAAARCVPVSWNGYGPGNIDSALPAQANTRGLVYGGGLEGMPELLEPWYLARKLFGNGPDIVRVANDPMSFFTLLDALEIRHPQVRLSPPPEGDGWLIKRTASTGGGHVRAWTGREETDARDYFQRRIEGPAMSVLFLADGERAWSVGCNTQWTRAGDYLWGGAVNRAGLTPRQRKTLLAHVGSLTSRLRLRGLNSLDFILEGDVPKVLELNPRPSATLELYDREFPRGLLYWHLQACGGRLPAPADRHKPAMRACRVVYAGQALAIPDDVVWPEWCHERPAAGVVVASGEPVCTVTAGGGDLTATLHRLRQRVARVERRLASLRRAA